MIEVVFVWFNSYIQFKTKWSICSGRKKVNNSPVFFHPSRLPWGPVTQLKPITFTWVAHLACVPRGPAYPRIKWLGSKERSCAKPYLWTANGCIRVPTIPIPRYLCWLKSVRGLKGTGTGLPWFNWKFTNNRVSSVSRTFMFNRSSCKLSRAFHLVAFPSLRCSRAVTCSTTATKTAKQVTCTLRSLPFLSTLFLVRNMCVRV